MNNFLFERFIPRSRADFFIKQIANNLGEKIVKFKGAGSLGRAYETESGKILKITTDPIEIRLAYKLSKNRNWFQYLINYYTVGKINAKINVADDFYNNKRTSYYILMNKVIPLEDDPDSTNTPEGRAIDQVYQGLIQYNPDYYNTIMNYNNIEDVIKNDWVSEEDAEVVRKIYPLIVNIVKELKLHGIKETDFHAGNIGWNEDKTKLILFDLGGFINTNLRVNLKRLKKLYLKKPKRKQFTENMITKFSDFKKLNS